MGGGTHRPRWFKSWCCKSWTRVVAPSWATLGNRQSQSYNRAMLAISESSAVIVWAILKAILKASRAVVGHRGSYAGLYWVMLVFLPRRCFSKRLLLRLCKSLHAILGQVRNLMPFSGHLGSFEVALKASWRGRVGPAEGHDGHWALLPPPWGELRPLKGHVAAIFPESGFSQQNDGFWWPFWAHVGGGVLINNLVLL